MLVYTAILCILGTIRDIFSLYTSLLELLNFSLGNVTATAHGKQSQTSERNRSMTVLHSVKCITVRSTDVCLNFKEGNVNIF